MNDTRGDDLSNAVARARPPEGLRARVIGIVRGRELDAYATVTLAAHAVVLSWDNAAAWQLDLDGLDGVMPRPNQLTLYLSSGDVLELTENDALRQLAANVLDRACAVPELTRGLRALGSLRGTPGPAHDRWFAPLLAARRAVAGISDAERQVALVDAANVAQQLRRVMTEIAREMAPTHPAMQRAIEASLHEESESTFHALERLALAADVLRTSTLDTRLVDWRRWMKALREVFVAADQCWPRCAKVITDGV
ncbi:MAG: hypothetical protein H7Z40_16485 [Phycisphaerae bacterium]|nr:hypothetical protein [Gemmatimonadaceae bacterium]